KLSDRSDLRRADSSGQKRIRRSRPLCRKGRIRSSLLARFEGRILWIRRQEGRSSRGPRSTKGPRPAVLRFSVLFCMGLSRARRHGIAQERDAGLPRRKKRAPDFSERALERYYPSGTVLSRNRSQGGIAAGSVLMMLDHSSGILPWSV